MENQTFVNENINYINEIQDIMQEYIYKIDKELFEQAQEALYDAIDKLECIKSDYDYNN